MCENNPFNQNAAADQQVPLLGAFAQPTVNEAGLNSYSLTYHVGINYELQV